MLQNNLKPSKFNTLQQHLGKMGSFISIICFMLFLMPNAFAQDMILKGGAFTLGPEFGFNVLDAGVEAKINKQIGVQISYSISIRGVENVNTKKIMSLQSRYYLNATQWRRSPFVGVVLQNFNQEKNTEAYKDNVISWTTLKTQKLALGVIIGKNFPLFKRMGLDFHLGYVAQRGDETRDVIYSGGTKPKDSFFSGNVVNTRFLWGINLYFVLNGVLKG